MYKTTIIARTACALLLVSGLETMQAKTKGADLKTQILLLNESGSGSSRTRSVSAERTFYNGERFRIRVRSEAAGHLYVICQSSQGEAKLLYPSEEGASAVEGGEQATVPESGWFRFDRHPGTERVFIVFSERRLTDLEKSAKQDGELSSSVFRRYTATSRDLRDDDDDDAEDNTAFARGIDLDTDQMTVKRISLRHEARDSFE